MKYFDEREHIVKNRTNQWWVVVLSKTKSPLYWLLCIRKLRGLSPRHYSVSWCKYGHLVRWTWCDQMPTARRHLCTCSITISHYDITHHSIGTHCLTNQQDAILTGKHLSGTNNLKEEHVPAPMNAPFQLLIHHSKKYSMHLKSSSNQWHEFKRLVKMLLAFDLMQQSKYYISLHAHW